MDHRVNLFTDPLWKYKLPNTIDTSWIKDKAYEIKKSDTNVFGGWQSFDEQEQFKFALPIPQGITLQEYLDERMNSIAKGLGLPAVSLLNYWFNVNPPGAVNEAHNHQNALLVGNLYIQVPKDSGSIRFYRSGEASYYVPKDAEYNDAIGVQTDLTLEEKDVIIFMGWQKHSVLQNKSKEDRISLSFNYGAIR